MATKKRQAVLDKTGGYCWYCGCVISDIELCLEHSHPRVKGGTSELDNLLPSCRKCNSTKGHKTVEEFRTWHEWQNVRTTPFCESQIAYLKRHGIELPTPPRHTFFGERQL